MNSHSPTLDDQSAAGRRDLPQSAATDPTAILFAALPSPPAPCPTCHCPQRWLSRYALPPANSTTPPPTTAWQCEACSPPPLPALVALRVTLVDVGDDDHFATIDDVLGIPVDATQWARIQTHQERDTRDPKAKARKVTTTTPVRCAANCNLLADGAGEAGNGEGEAEAGGSGSGSVNKSSRSEAEIYFDGRLGKIFHYAEMNGAFGHDAAPTGREFYRDVDDWWADGDLRGDWERIEIEVANYEKFVKPKLGKRA